MLWTAFAVGAAYAEVRTLPVKASLKGEVLTGELEVIDGTFLTLVVGSERHPLSVWDRSKTQTIVSALDALAEKAPDNRVIAAPYELTDGFKNAAVQNIFLTLSHPKTMSNLQVDKVQLDVTYAHRPLDQAELHRAKASVELEVARPAFAYDRPESYAIAFGDNVIPVRILEKIEQATTDRHGNSKKEWRARIVPLDEWWSREEKPRLSVMDVPVASLLFLDQDTTDLNVERIRKHGLTLEESMGVGMYELGTLTIDPKEDAVKQVKDFTADKKSDLAAIQRILLQSEQMRNAEASKVRAAESAKAEDVQRIRLLLEEYVNCEPEQREARLEEIRSLAPVPDKAHEMLLNILENYNGADKVKTRDVLVEIFKESGPLPLSTVFYIAGRSMTTDPNLKLRFREILRNANQDGAVERDLMEILTSPSTGLEQLSSTKVALKIMGASDSTKHQLLVALQVNDEKLREIARSALEELGPYNGSFLKEIAKLLESNTARESVVQLLLKLDPSDEALKQELIRLVKADSEPTKTAAGRILANLTDQWAWLADDDVATFVMKCRGQR